MSSSCKVLRIYKGSSVVEGAGVKLNRIFGYYELNDFDPFLLLDHFKSDNVDDFKAGFPFHPHRGIETITYLKKGSVEHRDKLGNREVLKANQVQWMTAGRGIYHQEMPLTDRGINGFQLWLNLPSNEKMKEAGYRTFTELPLFKDKNYRVTVISGEYKGIKGPGTSISNLNPVYFDIEYKGNGTFSLNKQRDDNAFVYLYDGEITIEGERLESGCGILLSEGDCVNIAVDNKASFLYISGRSLNEPISWWGPIVMNSDMEIEEAKEDLRNNHFI